MKRGRWHLLFQIMTLVKSYFNKTIWFWRRIRNQRIEQLSLEIDHIYTQTHLLWELWVARTLCKSDLLISSDSSSGKLFYRYVLQRFSVIWIRMFHKIKQETIWMTKNRGVIGQIMGFATTLWYAIKLGHYATKKNFLTWKRVSMMYC